MLQKTKGIVLRSIKYGDTSLICTIFTEAYGVQPYLMQGVRSAKAKNKAALLQPATLLDIVVYHKPQANLQRAKDFQLAYVYQNLQEHIAKNSIALFSVELLLRLLEEEAPMPELFEGCYKYFCTLDVLPSSDVANFPIYFMILCSEMLGFSIHGKYSDRTPHLNIIDGGFSEHTPHEEPYVSDAIAQKLHEILSTECLDDLKKIDMNADNRFKLLDWFLAFLHRHSQHMGEIKSLSVLRTVLH